MLLKHLSGSGPELRGRDRHRGHPPRPGTRIPDLLDRLVETGDRESKLAVVRTVAQLRAPNGAALLAVLWRDPDPTVRDRHRRGARPAGWKPRRCGCWCAGFPIRTTMCAPTPSTRWPDSSGTEAGPACWNSCAGDPSDRVRGAGRAGNRPPAHRRAAKPPCWRRASRAASAEVRAASLLALGGYEQESMVGRLVEMADDRALRDLLADRIRHDAGFRLLAQRLGASRHVELQALARHDAGGNGDVARRGAARRARTRPSACAWSAASARSRGTAAGTPCMQVVRSDPNPGVRAAALTAVAGMLDVAELERAAVRAPLRPGRGRPATAVALFGRLAPERALPSLIRLLRPDDDDTVVLQAVAAQAEASFDTFVDLTLGLGSGGPEMVTVSKVARLHPAPATCPRSCRRWRRAGRPRCARRWRCSGCHRPDLIDAELLLPAWRSDPVVARARGGGGGVRRRGARPDGLAALAADPARRKCAP